MSKFNPESGPIRSAAEAKKSGEFYRRLFQGWFGKPPSRTDNDGFDVTAWTSRTEDLKLSPAQNKEYFAAFQIGFLGPTN